MFILYSLSEILKNFKFGFLAGFSLSTITFNFDSIDI